LKKEKMGTVTVAGWTGKKKRTSRQDPVLGLESAKKKSLLDDRTVRRDEVSSRDPEKDANHKKQTR